MSLSTASAEQPCYPSGRLSVDQYHRLIAADVLTEDDKVELLEGWIVRKLSRDPAHNCTIVLVDDAVRSRVPAGWITRNQLTITTDDSEPEPDIAVVRGSPRDYFDHHPGPGEIGLIIEVANTSLDRDRTVKSRVFARAGISRYWIVNISEMCVEVFSDPTGPSVEPCFRQCRIYTKGDEVPLALMGQEVAIIPVQEMLP
jgi:Uma2 family endonuclease